jgi:hypothetical protein
MMVERQFPVLFSNPLYKAIFRHVSY